MQRYHHNGRKDRLGTFDGREFSLRARQAAWQGDAEMGIEATHPNMVFDHIRPDQIPGF